MPVDQRCSEKDNSVIIGDRTLKSPGIRAHFLSKAGHGLSQWEDTLHVTLSYWSRPCLAMDIKRALSISELNLYI